MAMVATATAVDADSGKVLYTRQVTQGQGTEAAKWARIYGYEVVDFVVTFHEHDAHTIVFYLRKKH